MTDFLRKIAVCRREKIRKKNGRSPNYTPYLYNNQDRTTSETGTLACYDTVLQTVYTLPPLIFVPTYLKVFWWPYSARGADPRDVISRTPQKPNHPIPPVDRAHFCASKCTQFRASRHSRAAFSEPDTKAERKCRKCPKMDNNLWN